MNRKQQQQKSIQMKTIVRINISDQKLNVEKKTESRRKEECSLRANKNCINK